MAEKDIGVVGLDGELFDEDERRLASGRVLPAEGDVFSDGPGMREVRPAEVADADGAAEGLLERLRDLVLSVRPVDGEKDGGERDEQGYGDRRNEEDARPAARRWLWEGNRGRGRKRSTVQESLVHGLWQPGHDVILQIQGGGVVWVSRFGSALGGRKMRQAFAGSLLVCSLSAEKTVRRKA